jgi:RNA polymerase sigma-70 factor, ECF subfamily
MPDEFYRHCQKLYDARAAQMILYGRALGLSHAEAEDLLQETFLAVMRLNVPPLRLEHYCLKTFRNRALNYHRGVLRRMLRELESRSWFEPNPTDSREEHAMRQLAELPAEQREVIALKIWQHYTFEEIGSLTGVSPNTAAARYRYGLQKLRACLNQFAYEDDRRIGKRTAGLDTLPSFAQAADQNFRPAEG